MPLNCTLLGEDDFNKVAGPIAVDSTTKGQYDATRDPSDTDFDPYHKYLGNCDNGDVQPLLPLFEFDFERKNSEKGEPSDGDTNYNDDDSNSDNEDNDDTKESVRVKVNYKFLTMPNKSDYMYNLYPMVQRRFNAANFGFHISGPYCYGKYKII